MGLLTRASRSPRREEGWTLTLTLTLTPSLSRREEGWIHHLARHSVACFLTRGDLYQSWEAGAAVFDEYLLDADWAINNGNWMWLSCSCFFYQASK